MAKGMTVNKWKENMNGKVKMQGMTQKVKTVNKWKEKMKPSSMIELKLEYVGGASIPIHHVLVHRTIH